MLNAKFGSFTDLSAFINFLNEKFTLNISIADTRYFAIVPNTSNASRMNLYLYRISNVDTTIVPNYNYYGVDIDGFTLNSCIRVILDDSVIDDYGVYSVNTNVTNITVPQHYYYMRSYFLFGNKDNSALLQNIEQNIEENTNSIKENTEVTQETQDFLKDDTNVGDNTINSMKDSFNNGMDIKGTPAQNNIFDLFSIIDNSDQSGLTSISFNIPFLNGAVYTLTIDHNLTQNFATTILGYTSGTLLTNIIRFLWSYFILKFILLNIISLIDKIKAGEIDKINTRNVLVDVL